MALETRGRFDDHYGSGNWEDVFADCHCSN